MPMPFISMYCDEKVAEREGNRRIRDGKKDVSLENGRFTSLQVLLSLSGTSQSLSRASCIQIGKLAPISRRGVRIYKTSV